MSSLARHVDGREARPVDGRERVQHSHSARRRVSHGYNRYSRTSVHQPAGRTASPLKDAFSWDHIDVHDGWLIFRLPPAELGVHPGTTPSHEITLMCDDLGATMAELAGKGVVFEGDPEDRGFGTVATMVLPGDVKMLLYEPRHKTAI